MSQLKKEKDIAGILALLFGFIGLHRFYLGQRGKGILYLLLAFTGISAILGLIDAFTFFSMDNKTFDIKYNRDFLRVLPKKEFETSGKRNLDNAKHNKKGNFSLDNGNIHVKSGKSKFLSYDYDGAILDFSKALDINPREIAAHFNIACAYSLNENIEKALFHLDKAVLYGFDDFEKIKIGIGRPNSKNPDVVAGYVLKDFPEDHLKLIKEGAYSRIIKGINALI